MFKQHHINAIFVSILKLFEKSDLSIIKRVYKILFDDKDAYTIDINKQNPKYLQGMVIAFRTMLESSPHNADNSQKPFIILKNLRNSCPELMKYILFENAYNFLHYAYKWGYSESSLYSNVMVQSMKEFIHYFASNMENLVYYFEDQLKLSASIENIYLVEFILKVVIAESDINESSKLTYIATLVALAQNQLKVIFNSLSNVPDDKPENYKTDKIDMFDKLVSFVNECLLIMQGFNNENDQNLIITEKTLASLEESTDGFVTMVNEMVFNGNNKDLISTFYQRFFSILIKLDTISKGPLFSNIPVNKMEDLPAWLTLNIKVIHNTYEMLNYHALKVMYSMFEQENKNKVIYSYNRFIYGNKAHYFEGKICWSIMERVVDIIEISDFKNLALNFFFKFVKLNLSFVSRFLLHLLSKKNSTEFKKVAILWKSTSRFYNSDCRLILQDTVFEMLSYVDIDDPLIRNYFKNWLMESKDNFSIIIDSVVKDINKYTNWKIEDDNVLYVVSFDCGMLLKSLKNLNIIFNNSTAHFIHYIINTEINPEFDFYNEELNIVLKKHFDMPQNTYLILIVKICLRYLIGRLCPESLKEDKTNHSERIIEVKSSISIFLEKLLKNLNNNDLVCHISLKLIPNILNNLEEALLKDQTSLQLEYVNLLTFLVYHSNLSNHPTHSKPFSSILGDKKFLDIMIIGLKSEHSFVVNEFISFINQLYFLLAKHFKHPVLTQIIKVLIFAYLNNIIDKYDSVSSLKHEELMKELVTVSLKGLKNCLDFFLQVNETEEKITSGNIEKAFLTIFTLGIVQTKDEIRKKISFLKDEETCNHIINNFELIFEKLLYCWKDTNVVHKFDINERYKNTESLTIKINEDDLSGVSRSIFKIIKPLSNNFMIRTIEALLENWIKNNEQLKLENTYEPNKNINNAKILELILYLNISPVRFLYSLQSSKQLKNIGTFKRYEQIKSKKEYHIIHDAVKYESHFLNYLYVYLKFTEIHDSVYFEVYGIVLNILKTFEASIFPSTLLWQIDIADLIVQKLQLHISSHSKLKQDWVTYLSDILIKCAKIVNKDITILYNIPHHTYSMVTPLNPSSYLLLNKNALTVNKYQIITKQGKFISRYNI